LRLAAAILVVFGLLSLAAIRFLEADPPAQEPESTASLTPDPSLPALAPGIVPEGRGRIEIVRPAKTEELPQVELQPLFETDMRVNAEETVKLRFAARDKISGHPVSVARVSASVFHGNDPEQGLKVDKVDDDVVEVELTPKGPGRFQVVLSMDGIPVGSEKVGVVGVAGAPGVRTEVIDPLSVDPSQFRARTPGRARRR
jgi:hypothetical protein